MGRHPKPVRLQHWTPNIGQWCWSTRSDMFDHMARAYGRLIAVAGALATPAPLRDRDDPWRLHVLSHPHGRRVLQARIVAPDGLPVAVAAAPWFIEGCDPGDFRNPPDGPWGISAWLSALEAVEWLGDVERYIGWAFLDSLRPMASA